MALLSKNWGIAFILLTIFAGPAQPAPRKIVEKPDWLRRPTNKEMLEHYPQRAEAENVSGRASIACMVTDEGRLIDCTASDEKPKGYGFAAAALAMSSSFLMTPKQVNGEAVGGGRVTVPVIFSFQEYRLGDDAMLIKRVGTLGPEDPEAFAVPCIDSYGECLAHYFDWAEQPDLRQSRRILDRATPSQGMTFAVCTVGIDGLLQGCKFTGDGSNDAMAVVNAVLPRLKAPTKTETGMPLAAATVVVPFAWEWIQKDKSRKRRP